jgi:pimeloyl-ACP methyl ester carboxylesterase
VSFAIRNTDLKRDRYFDGRGARLRYRVEGAGPALVLVHGWALDLELWDPVVAALSDRYAVVRLDRRGFGASEGVPDVGSDADDLLALLDHLGFSRASWVGMSQGARGVLRLAVCHPERVEALVLDGAPLPEAQLPVAGFREVLRDRGGSALRETLRRDPRFALHAGSAETNVLRVRMLDRYPARDLEPDRPDPAPDALRLDAIVAPVLVLTGEHESAERSRAGDTLAVRIPRARRVVLAGAGHLTCLDAPTAYGALILEFLAAAHGVCH